MDNEYVTKDPPHEELRTAFLLAGADADWLVSAAMRWLEDNPRAPMTALHAALGVSAVSLNKRCRDGGWPPPIKLRKMINVVHAVTAYLEGGSLQDAAGSLGYDMTWLSNACFEEAGIRPSVIRDGQEDVADLIVNHWRYGRVS